MTWKRAHGRESTSEPGRAEAVGQGPPVDVQSGIYLTGGLAAFVLLRRHNSFSASSRNSSGTPPREPNVTDA